MPASAACARNCLAVSWSCSSRSNGANVPTLVAGARAVFVESGMQPGRGKLLAADKHVMVMFVPAADRLVVVDGHDEPPVPGDIRRSLSAHDPPQRAGEPGPRV